MADATVLVCEFAVGLLLEDFFKSFMRFFSISLEVNEVGVECFRVSMVLVVSVGVFCCCCCCCWVLSKGRITPICFWPVLRGVEEEEDVEFVVLVLGVEGDEEFVEELLLVLNLNCCV